MISHEQSTYFILDIISHILAELIPLTSLVGSHPLLPHLKDMDERGRESVIDTEARLY